MVIQRFVNNYLTITYESFEVFCQLYVLEFLILDRAILLSRDKSTSSMHRSFLAVALKWFFAYTILVMDATGFVYPSARIFGPKRSDPLVVYILLSTINIIKTKLCKITIPVCLHIMSFLMGKHVVANDYGLIERVVTRMTTA